MLSFKTPIFACALLIPFSVGFADDQVTQTLRDNTYQESGQISCSGDGGCAVIFPETKHMTTAVTGVSCYAEIDQGAQISFASLGDDSFGPVKFYVQPFYASSGGGKDMYQMSALTNLYFSKGKKPAFQLFPSSGAVAYLSCIISGYHS